MPTPRELDHRDYCIERARQEAEIAVRSTDTCAAAVHLKMSEAYLQRADDIATTAYVARGLWATRQAG